MAYPLSAYTTAGPLPVRTMLVMLAGSRAMAVLGSGIAKPVEAARAGGQTVTRGVPVSKEEKIKSGVNVAEVDKAAMKRKGRDKDTEARAQWSRDIFPSGISTITNASGVCGVSMENKKPDNSRASEEEDIQMYKKDEEEDRRQRERKMKKSM
ncbi:uncharacterized protein MONOS_8153 [Monocercomonoides exilis]|uniref:uncharacterized protein n=1 Tax=Monocercomonoides exilis TaxID=2049356 RepID=UPI003559B8EC|nr:hypothetical protein MONOS_8153 [Monocercomonoides exilis]|eukprot:MONOS_8153.1-p1 / transcript=MONOS_8153.1 / gene=MONOS_8153 / organism=Monocercomonoides_exilis_PA203 / gene_product=unspecified product / transcript_product=unspecified product / location=Mono_scaffold00298:62507-62965(+) / protein_length=153 / sequence_SO=supercontig / SO=protein_coding / is_pseudo=false